MTSTKLKKKIYEKLTGKGTLWARKLDCGHERRTDIAYLMNINVRPDKGSLCYCRECHKESKIVSCKKIEDTDVLDESKRIWGLTKNETNTTARN